MTVEQPRSRYPNQTDSTIFQNIAPDTPLPEETEAPVHIWWRPRTNQARTRMGLSARNQQRYLYHLKHDGQCDQSRDKEDMGHYIFQCPRYNQERRLPILALQRIPDLDPLRIHERSVLCGLKDVNENTDYGIFELVHLSIIAKNRFS